MKIKKIFLISLTIMATNFLTYAQAEIQLGGSISSLIPITKQTTSNINAPQKKEVYLMNVKLTPKQQNLIWNYNLIKTSVKTNPPLPDKVYIGMNGVPVLDQGKHGTCVTFANTAALDALLGKGDYISQLCNLELGSYISKNGALETISPQSGWNGSSGNIVLNQILSFGFINKSNQKIKSCGGLTDYPVNDHDEIGKPMPLEEFHSLHEDFVGHIEWDELLSTYERLGFNHANPNPYDSDKVLIQVKQFLVSSDPKKKENTFGLVTFASFLPYKFCSAGACGRYHQSDDSWVITNAMKNIDPVKDYMSLAGHEMIIIGYDDEAIAVDNEGVKHKGLLILRNSWGDDVGDQGNNYMSYDFFKKFVAEVQLIYQPNFN
jgi:hypothetical protein